MEATTLLCPRCGTAASAVAVFCTACGAVIHPDLVGGEQDGATPAQHPAAEQRAPVRRRITPKRVIAAALVLVVIAAVAALGVAWRSEANAHHAADAKAASLSGQLASTRASLANTRASLAQVQTIARKRKAVLLQAGSTLREVDPLLTKVDGLKSAAEKASAANSAWGSSLVDAYTYLNDTSYLDLDVAYLSSLVDRANSLLLEAETAGAAYGRAVTAFGNNADSFTQSVRALQRQLKSVTAG